HSPSRRIQQHTEQLERLRRQPGARGPRRRAATAASSARTWPTGHTRPPHPTPLTSTTAGGRARGRPKAGNLDVLHPRRGARATPATAGSSRTSTESGDSREPGEALADRPYPAAAHTPFTSTTTGGRARGRPKAGRPSYRGSTLFAEGEPRL